MSNVIHLQEVTFHAAVQRKGSNMITINVDVDGKPYAQIWTFKARNETHPWHAKLVTGKYDVLPTKAVAMNWVKNCAALGYL